MISTTQGTPASCLGLAAYPRQDPQCVRRAFESGINFFFFYGPGQTAFVKGVKPLVEQHRAEIILASGSGSRTAGGLRTAYRRIQAALATDLLDIFFAEYLHPGDDANAVFGVGGILDELQRWKAMGWIRYVGASAHNRTLARRLAQDSRIDVLMHRFNMAHRKATEEVFPFAMAAQTPVIAFTATRWRSLLEPRDGWTGAPPTAADCYQYCLAHEAVRIVLTAPMTVAELEENLTVLKLAPMKEDTCQHWQRFGDLFHNQAGVVQDEYEKRWP